jgi:RNA polymerase sigma-70 factor, ECF subfamily
MKNRQFGSTTMTDNVDHTAGPPDTAAELADLSGSFERNVAPLRMDMYRYALHCTRNPADAEDLVQDTMLNAFRAYDGLRTNACLKAWLMTIMRNAWISKYRITTRRPPETLLSDVSRGQSSSAAPIVALGSNSAESEVLRYVLDPDLAVAFARLSDEMRTTMFYVAVGGMRCQDVAKIMGVPMNTVLTRVHRSKNALRRSLSELSEER